MSRARVLHAHLWGTREHKYAELLQESISTTRWTELKPDSPFYVFAPQDDSTHGEFDAGWAPGKVFGLTSTGVKTHRDHFAYAFRRQEMFERIRVLRDLEVSDGSCAQRFALADTRDWKLTERRLSLAQDTQWEGGFVLATYRPFDLRHLYYHSDVLELTRAEVMDHFLAGPNLALGLGRQGLAVGGTWDICITSARPIDTNLFRRGGVQVFPLYIYSRCLFQRKRQGSLLSESNWPESPSGRTPNLSRSFVSDSEGRLGLRFVSDGAGDLAATFGPEDVFHYIYAVFHSPSYRERYAEFLKIDFPRVPLTSNLDLFRALCHLGSDLVALHLLEDHYPHASWTRAGNPSPLAGLVTRYPVPGDDAVEKGHPKYLAPGELEAKTRTPLEQGRVYISRDDRKTGKQGQYFEGVPPEVWEFHVGGYQVCEKWLKDRQGRKLTYEDLTHYQRVVVALKETIRLMTEIDESIDAHGGWPIR